jgi:hypothetical protein
VKERLIIFIYRAPYLQELDYVVNYTNRQVDNGKPVMVHCQVVKEERKPYWLHILLRKEMFRMRIKILKTYEKSEESRSNQKTREYSFQLRKIGERPSTENNTNIK